MPPSLSGLVFKLMDLESFHNVQVLQSSFLTFTAPWANLSDDKLMTFFLFFLRNFNAYSLEKKYEKYFKMTSAEFFSLHADHEGKIFFGIPV